MQGTGDRRRSSERCEARIRAAATIIQEFAAAEENWGRITASNRQEAENIKDYAAYLSEEIAQLAAIRPKCWLLGENYDNAFSTYQAKVEEVRSSNRRALKVLDDCIHAAAKLRSVHEEIETLRELDAKNNRFWDDWQKNYSKEILEQLESLKSGFELLTEVKLEREGELRRELERNSSILEQLVQSTHKWMPIEEQSIIIKPAWNPPEGSSMEPRKAELLRFVSKSKCEKCSKQRTG